MLEIKYTDLIQSSAVLLTAEFFFGEWGTAPHTPLKRELAVNQQKNSANYKKILYCQVFEKK